jgi:polysaccharide biosynthesis transport protein
MFQSKFRMSESLGFQQDQTAEPAQSGFGLPQLLSAIRRQIVLVVACCLAGLAMGLVYLLMATPLYSTSATIIIDKRQVRAVRDISTLSDSPSLDTAEIESQVEVLHSTKIGLAVVRALKLSEDPAFASPRKSLPRRMWGAVVAMIGAKGEDSKQTPGVDPGVARELTAVERLNRDLRVSRVGRTFVLEVTYTSSNPALAAEIANAYTDAYMFEQLNSRIEATRRARSWLQQRTEELRQQSVESDLVAQKFKADNNLLASKGTLISEQQLTEMSTQLVTYRAATAEAQARYLRIKHIIDTHQTEAAVTESLSNPVIANLRTQYLEASKRYSALARRLDPNHMALVNFKHTMDEIAALLFEELGRVEESYRNDYEVAVAREKALTANLANQQKVAVTANDAQVQLHQLEQKAQSFGTLYDSYLQRYQEAAQQESFPMTDGHVVSGANQPLEPSQPRKYLVLALSMAIGTMAGAGAGIVRELMDRVFRTAEQVRDDLGVEVLGMLPLVGSAALPPPVSGKMTPMMRYVIDDSFSAFAETLRSAKVNIDLAIPDRCPKIIGLVSLLPKEGKTTVAKNFASLLALQGTKTLLIDADTRNPALTRGIGCERRAASQGDVSTLPPLDELAQLEAESGLKILPCIFAKNDPRIAHGFTSETLHTLLRSSSQAFEYVVIDLPPIGALVNARGMAPAIDAFIFVVAWGATSRGPIRAALAKEHVIRNKLIGVVLNKVDMKKLQVYEHFDSENYYYKRFENYYKHPT